MKLKSLILTGLAVLTLAAAPLQVSAYHSVLADDANLLDTSAAEKVDDALADAAQGHECDVMIHTTKDTGNYSVRDYADLYYEEYHNDMEEDGIILVVDITTREYYILTSGLCIRAFTDMGLDYIESEIVPDMQENDFETAFVEFAGFCDDYLKQAEAGKPYDGDHMPKKPYNVGLSLLISLLVGSASGGVGIAGLFANLKSVKKQEGAADYTKANSFKVETSSDVFLYKNVTRMEKEDDSTRGAGGSSTFTGPSGSTRGGSGGSF